MRPWEGAVREEMFPHSGKPLQWLGDQPAHKGSFRGLEESAAASGQQLEQRENCTHDQGFCPAFPSLRHVSARVDGSWVLELGLWRSEPGRGLG